MLEMNINYNCRNSILLPFWGIFLNAANFGGGGGRGVTFGRTVTFGI